MIRQIPKAIFDTTRLRQLATKCLILNVNLKIPFICYLYAVLIITFLLLEEDVSLRSFVYHLMDLFIISEIVDKIKRK